ncbi:hypothetical protein BUPH_05236 [Paraburkholderia phenoliruptrix BR3459a]|uniref:Uncharacterized protein n=1 Tax=Paraburkholderia phenoliruptrix BR3459a TaxID=1229205 RepID=K0DK04_9BURK|nr:hypothetical protein BUPH_05236 [Paraburkholderia phenoliruptrix BR3459a]
MTGALVPASICVRVLSSIPPSLPRTSRAAAHLGQADPQHSRLVTDDPAPTNADPTRRQPGHPAPGCRRQKCDEPMPKMPMIPMMIK